MSRAQTVDVLNDSTTLQSRIDTVLAAPDLDWANDSGWQPGDPLYEHPWDSERWNPDVQYVRRMVEIIHEPDWSMRCDACQVSWAGSEACWLCGDPATERKPFAMSFGDVPLFPNPDWASAMAEAMRPMTEALERMTRQLATFSIPRLYVAGIDSPREEAPRPSVSVWVLPDVEDVAAPTLSELAAAQPLGDELLYMGPAPAIRFPNGSKVTPVVEHDVPPLTLAATRPELYRPPAERFRFNRPATETRRPRRTA